MLLISLFLTVDQIKGQHQIVVFAVDGLLSTMIGYRFMPAMDKIMGTGCTTMKMRTMDATVSEQATWGSIFYSADVSSWGCDKDGCNEVPKAAEILSQSWIDLLESNANYGVALFSDKPREIEKVLGRDVEKVDYRSLVFSSSMLHLPGDNDQRIILFHFSGLNEIGRTSGYDSVNYRAFVACIDRALFRLTGKLWPLAKNTTTFMLLSNHGGSGHGHSHFDIKTLQVPFAMWGYGMGKRQCHIGLLPVETMQIAPTLFSIFNQSNLIPESSWHDRPIDIPFRAGGANFSDYVANATLAEYNKYECNVYRATSYDEMRRNILFLLSFAVLFMGFMGASMLK